MEENRTNIYLAGFMGVGKSAIGRNLARRLGMSFFDVDRSIEKKAGMPVKQIFTEKGEECFRQLEREFIETGHPAQGCVVACGGGTIMQPGMAARLKAKGMIFCLFASAETLHKRTSRTQKRPLLEVENPKKRIEEMLADREPAYLQAGIGICTENRAIEDVAAHITRIYQRNISPHAAKHKKPVK